MRLKSQPCSILITCTKITKTSLKSHALTHRVTGEYLVEEVEDLGEGNGTFLGVD